MRFSHETGQKPLLPIVGIEQDAPQPLPDRLHPVHQFQVSRFRFQEEKPPMNADERRFPVQTKGGPYRRLSACIGG
jgi:hypothetical protein